MLNRPRIILTMAPIIELNALSAHQLLALHLPARLLADLITINTSALASGNLPHHRHQAGLHFFDHLPAALSRRPQLAQLAAYATFLAQHLPASAPLPAEHPIYAQAAQVNSHTHPYVIVYLPCTLNTWLHLATLSYTILRHPQTLLQYYNACTEYLILFIAALHNNHFTDLAHRIQRDLDQAPPRHLRRSSGRRPTVHFGPFE